MRKIIIVPLVIFLFNSCVQKEINPVFPASLIDSMCVEIDDYIEAEKKGEGIFVDYINLPIYLKLDATNYIKSNSFEIHKVYVKKYKNDIDRFDVFLNEVVNNNFKFNKNDFEKETFSLDNAISKKFNELEINNFLNYYSMKDSSENKPYLNEKIKTKNEYLTISYFLFTKGYYIGKDDLRGRGYIYRFDKLVAKVPN